MNANFMTDPWASVADPDLLREGYTATIDSGNGPVVYWVCQECFHDLAEPFSLSAM
jgi:hypothetical protein